MTARNVSLEATVSRVGTNRWRPAQATGSPSAPRMTTPRSTPGAWPRASIATSSCSKAASRGSRAALMPRAARRRASATAAASAPRSSAESRGTSSARTSVQQHSIRRTSRTPATTTTPSSRDASAARPEAMVRGPRTTAKPAVASPATPRPYAGNATVRRKTLHRWMNDLLGSWEQTGVDAFIILTAHGHDPHQEALSTLRTRRARVFTVDVFALDFGGHLADPDG